MSKRHRRFLKFWKKVRNCLDLMSLLVELLKRPGMKDLIRSSFNLTKVNNSEHHILF